MINNIAKNWRYQLNTWRSDEDALPSILVIGAQKAATTSLHRYLTYHPQIQTGRTKEVNFFNWNYEKGKKHYKYQFPFRRKVWYIDASPSYLYQSWVPERVAELLGQEVKLIVSLRDPIERAYSAWNMYRQLINNKALKERWKQLEHQFPHLRLYSVYASGNFPTFEEAIAQELKWIKEGSSIEEPSLIRRGFYVSQIENWMRYFPRECFYFLSSHQLQTPSSFQHTLQEIAQFLGVDSNMFEELKPKIYNQRIYVDSQLSKELYHEIDQLFQQKNEGIDDLTSIQLPWRVTDGTHSL